MKKTLVVAAVSVLTAPALLPAAPVHAAVVASALAASEDWRERTIRRAFDDVLRRDPSRDELRRYRDLMQDRGWSEDDVRDDLRRQRGSDRRSDRRSDRSDRRTDSRDAERIVRRAYQDILQREPDTAGLRLYRSRIIDDGWSEKDVREAIRKSPENRQQDRMTREKAEEIVRRAYRSILDRDPDSSSRGYVDKVLREKWSQSDVERELRKSPEYRNRRR